MKQPYDHLGRFISKKCVDPNCDGELVYEGPTNLAESFMRDSVWCCDGLTYEETNGPLRACGYCHFDGDKRE